MWRNRDLHTVRVGVWTWKKGRGTRVWSPTLRTLARRIRNSIRVRRQTRVLNHNHSRMRTRVRTSILRQCINNNNSNKRGTIIRIRIHTRTLNTTALNTSANTLTTPNNTKISHTHPTQPRQPPRSRRSGSVLVRMAGLVRNGCMLFSRIIRMRRWVG